MRAHFDDLQDSSDVFTLDIRLDLNKESAYSNKRCLIRSELAETFKPFSTLVSRNLVFFVVKISL